MQTELTTPQLVAAIERVAAIDFDAGLFAGLDLTARNRLRQRNENHVRQMRKVLDGQRQAERRAAQASWSALRLLAPTAEICRGLQPGVPIHAALLVLVRLIACACDIEALAASGADPDAIDDVRRRFEADVEQFDTEILGAVITPAPRPGEPRIDDGEEDA